MESNQLLKIAREQSEPTLEDSQRKGSFPTQCISMKAMGIRMILRQFVNKIVHIWRKPCLKCGILHESACPIFKQDELFDNYASQEEDDSFTSLLEAANYSLKSENEELKSLAEVLEMEKKWDLDKPRLGKKIMTGRVKELKKVRLPTLSMVISSRQMGWKLLQC